MPKNERIREPLTGLPTLEHLVERTAEGWKLIALEWERPAAAAPAHPPLEVIEEIPYGLQVSADCTGGDVKKLRRIFDTDEGAAHVGEWSIGCNPRILNPMRDILFDEKIAGSFHLTPGNAYDEADNGNRSKIHWDLVQIQRPEHGGGTIAFDGVPVRVDGRFVPEDLQALDPE